MNHVPMGRLRPEQISQRICVVRGHRVMLDRDLAALYGVTTFNLNKAVKRNPSRFPSDFMFRLTGQESSDLTFQIGIPSASWGGRRRPPFAFTEQGVAMLSSVLRSERAVEVNVAIIRAFVRLREVLAANAELARKLSELERHVASHDENIRALFKAIRALMAPPRKRRPSIGFKP